MHTNPPALSTQFHDMPPPLSHARIPFIDLLLSSSTPHGLLSAQKDHDLLAPAEIGTDYTSLSGAYLMSLHKDVR